MSDVNINSNELKEMKAMIVEMTNCFIRIDEEKEQLKDIAAAIEDKFNIKKKLINKIAKTMYNHNYSDLQAENEHFQFLYEAIAEGKKVNE